jgi:hypothetical protein
LSHFLVNFGYLEAGLGPLLNYVSEDLLPFERDAKKTLRMKHFFEKANETVEKTLLSLE